MYTKKTLNHLVKKYFINWTLDLKSEFAYTCIFSLILAKRLKYKKINILMSVYTKQGPRLNFGDVNLSTLPLSFRHFQKKLWLISKEIGIPTYSKVNFKMLGEGRVIGGPSHLNEGFLMENDYFYASTYLGTRH